MKLLLEHIKNIVFGFVGGAIALVAALLVFDMVQPRGTGIDPVSIVATLRGFSIVLAIFSLGFYLVLTRKLARGWASSH